MRLDVALWDPLFTYTSPSWMHCICMASADRSIYTTCTYIRRDLGIYGLVVAFVCYLTYA
jgi:hypothetical protein